MGKHLTIQEKLNAPVEFQENKQRIAELYKEIAILRYRQERLRCFLEKSKFSKHKGLYGINGFCYKKFEKRVNDLTPAQRRKYNRIKTKESRARKKKATVSKMVAELNESVYK